MIKLLFFILFLFTSYANSFAQDELFTKIFGNKEIETNLNLIIQDKDFGDIEVLVKGNNLMGIDSKILKAKLELALKEDKFEKLNFKNKWTRITDLQYPISYNQNKLIVDIKIPLTDLKPTFYSLETDPHFKYAGVRLEPAPLSASINYLAEKTFGDEYLGGERFSAYFRNFINLNSFVLSIDGNYEEKNGVNSFSRWQRGDANLTKDFLNYKVRSQLGDTNSSRFDFMQSQRIGGINIRKQFSIDPYMKPFSQGQREFQVLRRSKVKTYVNGTLVKNEILSAGNYSLVDLPLINGINNIRVEIDDEVSPRKVLEFNIPVSISILKKGETNFSLSSGKKIDDSNISRTYSKKSYSSGFFQYGLTHSYSIGLYAQKDDLYELGGLSQGYSSSLGNLFWGIAKSKIDQLKGDANSLTWQYQNISGAFLKGVSVITRYESFNKDFRTSINDQGPSLKDSSDISFAFPVFTNTSLNLGGGVSHFKDSSYGKKEFYRSSLSLRPTPNISINLFASSSKSTTTAREDSLSLFITWNFGQSDYFISTYNNLKDKDSRVTLTKNNSNQLYTSRYNISYNETEKNKNLSGALDLPTPMADFFLKSRVDKNLDDKKYELHSIGLSSSLLFAYDNGFGFSLSRPNSGSFAIFKRSENLKDQDIKVRSTSTFADTESPLFGDPAITNLIPYQYRDIQIDPTLLRTGLSLKQEKYILQPTYKSGHLIKIEDKGLKAIQGKILNNNRPVALKVGSISGTPFFTDREGFFYVDGIDMDEFKISILNKKSKTIKINKDKIGIIDIGSIKVD